MPSRTRIELFLSIEEFKKGAIKSPKKTNNKIITKIELTSTFRKKSILLGDQTTDLIAAENLRIKSIRTCYDKWDYSSINQCVSILLKEF